MRRRAGLTQEALAERVGVEQGTVSRWERDIERPRPRSARALRNLFQVEVEKAVTLRQLATIRNNLVIGGLLDAQTRLKEVSGRAADFYMKRSRFDIYKDFGKSLERQLLEKGGEHSWDVVQGSGVLSGEVLLLRMFLSVEGYSYLTQYEPIYQDGEFSGIFAYIARSVPIGIGTAPPVIRYAEAIRWDDPGKVEVIHRSASADKVRTLLTDTIPV